MIFDPKDYTTEIMGPSVCGFAVVQKHGDGARIHMDPHDFSAEPSQKSLSTRRLHFCP